MLSFAVSVMSYLYTFNLNNQPRLCVDLKDDLGKLEFEQGMAWWTSKGYLCESLEVEAKGYLCESLAGLSKGYLCEPLDVGLWFVSCSSP